MEHISMTAVEASHYQAKFKYLEGTEFIDKKDNEKHKVVAILMAPSDKRQFCQFCQLVSHYNVGAITLQDVEAFRTTIKEDKFTPVAFCRKVSSQLPYHSFQPAQYLVGQDGDMEIGFAL